VRPYSPALLERLAVIDATARPVIEAVALVETPAGLPQQDSRFRPDQWALADSVAGLAIDAFGGVSLLDTTITLIQNLLSNVGISDLDGPVTVQAASPFFAALVSWDANTYRNPQIDRVTLNLHPQFNPANAKTVAVWHCQLYGITDLSALIAGTNLQRVKDLVPLAPPIDVPAIGNAQGDVVFSWVGQAVRPRPRTVASAFFDMPTVCLVWATQADGTPATNVAWMADTTHTIVNAGLTTLQGIQLFNGGDGLLLDQLTVEPVPRLTFDMGSFVAAKVQFSGGGNQFTLPQVPTQTVEFQCEADVPTGASCVFEVLKDGGVAANDPDWLAITDGMTTDDPSLGGHVSKRATYQLRARLLPSAAGDATPIVRALGVREVTITDASSVARITNVRWAVDPPTLKAEIPQATLVALRDGDRDFQDLVTTILSLNDLGNLLIRTWVGDQALPRSQWIHIDDFLIDDTAPGGATISLTLLSVLTLLRGAVPQYAPATLAPPTADLANPGGFTNESGGAALFSHVNETIPDDTTYLQSVLHPAATECELAVQAIADPHLSTCHEIDIRYGKDVAGGDFIDITVQLRQGLTVIAAKLFQNVPAGFTLGTLALSAAQADTITDYTNLRLHFIINVNGGGGGGRRGRVSYALFQITARRTPVVYNNQSLAAVAQDLIQNEIELPARYQGAGVADTTTLVSKAITDSDAKAELDAIAFAAGVAYISSQGRVKAVDFMGGAWSSDPTPTWTLNPSAVVAVIPSEEIQPLDVTPGYRQRVPQYFAKWGWDPVAGKYAAEVRGFNAGALAALGAATLDPPVELDDIVAQYLQTAPQAQAIAQRQVQTLGAGMILLRFRTTYPRPWLELGDVIAIQTDRFVAKDPNTARSLKGQLWVIGKVQEIGDFLHREFAIWVRSYADLLAASEAANRLGFSAPLVGTVTGTIDGSGNVNVAIGTTAAESVRVAASTAGVPARATIEAAAPVAVAADGTVTIAAVFSPLLAGQTCYIGVLAFENADGSGAESSAIGLATVASPVTPVNGLLAVRPSWKANHLIVNVEGGPGTASFKIATSTVSYPLAGTGTVTNGQNGDIDVGAFTYGQTVFVTVTPYSAAGGGGSAGSALGAQSTLSYGDGVFDLGGGHVLRSSSFDDGKFAVQAADSAGAQAARAVQIQGQLRTLAQMLTELVPNAEFDIWESTSQPHAWTVDTTAGAVCARESAAPFSGDYALKYSNPDNASNAGWHGVATNDLNKGAFCVPLRAGLTYRMKIAAKASRVVGGQEYRVVVSFNAAETLQQVQTFPLAVANAWQVDSFILNVPSAAEANSKVYVQLNRNGDATATDFWIDSLRLVEDTPSIADLVAAASVAGTNIVQNPGFEAGVAYWRQVAGGSLDSTAATPIAGARSGVIVAVASTLARIQQCDRASDLSGGQNPSGGAPLYVAVTGGDEVFGSLQVTAGTLDATAVLNYSVEEYDATKALIQRTVLATRGGIAAPVTMAGGMTLQATTAYIVVVFEVTPSAGGGGITYRWDGVTLYRVSPPKRRVKALLNAAQALVNNTLTKLAWNGADEFDVGAMHDPTGAAQANTELIAPVAVVGYGALHLHAQVQFAANAVGIRKVQIKKNNATIIAESECAAVNGDVTTIDCSVVVHHPAAGDFYEVLVLQTSGGNLNATSGPGTSFFEAHQLV
jgi:hypothetical protein